MPPTKNSSPFFFCALREHRPNAEGSHEVFDRPPNQALIFPSFAKVSNEWGYTETRNQGNRRAFSYKKVTSPRGHVKATATLPYTIENGFQFLPENDFSGFWEKRLRWVRKTAKAPEPELDHIRVRLAPKEFKTKAKLHIPLLAKLLDMHGMGGRGRLKQFTEGSPVIGELAETGVYLPAKLGAPKHPRGELIEGAKDGAAFPEARKDQTASDL